MARYVVASRRSGLFSEAEKAASRMDMANALDSMTIKDIVADNAEQDDDLARRVVIVEMEPSEAESYTSQIHGSVIVEPEILHFPVGILPPDLRDIRPWDSAFALNANSVPITLRITGNGNPLPGADVILFTRFPGGGNKFEKATDNDGHCTIHVPQGHQAVAAVVVPEGGYWSIIARGAELNGPIDCPALPTNGPFDWWHNIVGRDEEDPNAGEGIRVGVIDTGIWDHPSLAHAQWVGAFIDGHKLPIAQARDVAAHGTHVAATIGGRPSSGGDYAGLAPGSELLAARVFKDKTSGATNADIANAIDELSREHGVDLINLSLGASMPSQVVQDAIADAEERGTLCICAAGNEAGQISYPAAFPQSVAIAALGMAGQYPASSLSASRIPHDGSLHGVDSLFAANFTCFGMEMDSSAPGVGIIAPVPNRVSTNALHGVMDGTSMASPVACGALASRLAKDEIYQSQGRNINRANRARAILSSFCKDIGLPPSYQGRGMVTV